MANGSVLAGISPQPQPDLAGSLLGGVQGRQNVLAGQQMAEQRQFNIDQAPQVAERQAAESEQRQQINQQQIGEADFNMAVQRARVENRLARQIRDLPLGERERFKQSLDPGMLQSLGIDPQQVAQVGTSDQALDDIIRQTDAALATVDGGGGDEPTPRFSKIDPKDYTAESVERFQETGNYGDLSRVDPDEGQRSREEAEEISREISNAQETISQVDNLINNERYVDALTGLRGTLPGAPGTAGFDADVAFNQFVDSLTLENLGKMSGVLSETDIQILSSAASGLKAGMSEDAFRSRMETIRDTLEGKAQDARRRLEGRPPEDGQRGQGGQSDGSTPRTVNWGDLP